MSTRIWKVQFKENMERFDIAAKNANQAVRIAVKLFQEDIERNIKDFDPTQDTPNPTPWRWYVRNGYTQPEHIELIAESDN